MIAQVRGRLADKRPSQLLVDVNGVGYQRQVAANDCQSTARFVIERDHVNTLNPLDSRRS